MAFGSYIRFGIGIILSLEVIRIWLTGGQLSSIAAILSILFLVLSAMWFAFRF